MCNEKCKADISKLKSPLHGLRYHDLRHHAITELAESQASERTIMAIAGHISPRMLEHHGHIRMDAKRKALEALGGKSVTGGYDTRQQIHVLTGSLTRNLLKRMAGTTGLEPAASAVTG